MNRIQQNKKEIEQLKFEADRAEREGDYGKVAEIWRMKSNPFRKT